MEKIKQKISINLWFNNEAEEAADYYTSIFKNSKIEKVNYYTKAGQDIHKKKEGSVMTVEFTLDGQRFVALNGGPVFKFNEAVSLIINCKDQKEVDYFWDRLTAGGDKNAQQCGWLKDKYGVSWQVVPEMISDLFDDHQSENAQRAMNAMMEMKKLDIEKLQQAYDGKNVKSYS